MSLIDDIRDWMRATVTIEPATGHDGYGQAVYGASRAVPAYIVGRVRTVRTFSGDERVSTVQVYLGEAVSAGPNDRLTLPSPWTPSTPSLLAVERLIDDAGEVFEVLYA